MCSAIARLHQFPSLPQDPCLLAIVPRFPTNSQKNPEPCGNCAEIIGFAQNASGNWGAKSQPQFDSEISKMKGTRRWQFLAPLAFFCHLFTLNPQALVSTTTPLDLADIRTQLATHLQSRGWCDDPTSITLMAHGEANLIFWLGGDRLVRVAVNTPNQRFGGNFQRVTQFEQTVLTYLKGCGIGHDLLASKLEPTPDFAYTYLITNYLPGNPLSYSREHLQQCAQTLAQLHRLPGVMGYEIEPVRSHLPHIEKPLTTFFQEARDYAQPYLESAQPDPEIVTMLKTVLQKAEARLSAESLLQEYPYQSLVHGDHTYENWVINDERAHLVDWEWAEIGSPAGDLGHFLSPVTVRRKQGYRIPEGDRAFFLHAYYDALEDPDLAHRMERHFAAFGPYPALRSLCWTAGYWITANRWYADSPDSPVAAERVERLRRSQEEFPGIWDAVMAWFDEPL